VFVVTTVGNGVVGVEAVVELAPSGTTLTVDEETVELTVVVGKTVEPVVTLVSCVLTLTKLSKSKTLETVTTRNIFVAITCHLIMAGGGPSWITQKLPCYLYKQTKHPDYKDG
jgi:hypothetical protein